MNNFVTNIANVKSNRLLIIIIILSITALVLGGYICYDKFLSNDNRKQTESNKPHNTNNGKKTKEENGEVKEKPKNSGDNTATSYADSIPDLDLDELVNILYSFVHDDGKTTFVSVCENLPTKLHEPPKVEKKNVEVAVNTIDTVINKLKTAKLVGKGITFSWFGCPPKSIEYFISANSTDSQTVYDQNVFYLSYANANDVLLVAYSGIGYVFKFNSSEEIDNFIESLK